MQIHHGFLSWPKSIRGVVMTLGNFDGVHLGHQELLGRVVSRARASGQAAVALTFDPHPSRVLRPTQPTLRVLEPEQTYREMARVGIQHLVVVQFDRARAQQSAQDFLHEIGSTLAPSAIVVGHDFAFGHSRAGTFAVLQAYGEQNSCKVEQVSPVTFQGELVSSSLLRRCLGSGEVEKLNQFLGRSFELRGRVQSGEGRGASLGFATANVVTQNEILPASGVYVTEFCAGDRALPSVTNIGRKPTFHEVFELTVETHVLQVRESFVGQEVGVKFLKRLRPELKFPSARELIEQIGKDVFAAKSHFGI
jgi:riboflavin kinase/FMN adenylyltransferase